MRQQSNAGVLTVDLGVGAIFLWVVKRQALLEMLASL